MKTRSKALLLTLCAVLLIAASVLGTMAYLTSTAEVNNTFTVGQVKITMDEAKVDEYGKAEVGTDEKPVDRVIANSYKLIPGHTYTKDPIVHVDPESENCYIFIKVENGIAALEATGKTIASQIEANGWKAVTGESGVYYKEYTKKAGGDDLKVFDGFTIADDANAKTDWGGDNTTVTVNAYAIQKDGFGTPDKAWAEVKPKV